VRVAAALLMAALSAPGVELPPLRVAETMGVLDVLDQLVDFGVLRVDVRPLIHAGQERHCQFCVSLIG
jgi:hypothetical protein